MGWLNKKADPISERSRALSDEIAALEAQIKQLESAPVQPQAPIQTKAPAPRLRSTAMPHGATANPAPSAAPTPKATEPIFEVVDQNRLQAKGETTSTPEHFNDLGIRKYDLAAFFRRVKNHFSGPPTTNPKLVNYLAAGSIQGLRPMRYEKRVARNRFLLGSFVLLAFLFGIFLYIHNH